MNKDKASFSNQTHQLMVTLSRHLYISQKGILTYQEKPFDATLNNYHNFKKELLVYYVVIDRFSGNFIFQVATTRQILPLADFLYYAWRHDKDETHFWGLPDSIAIPRAVSSPSLFRGLEKVGAAPFNPTAGFPSGGHVIKALEERLWSQILYRSMLHFKASIEMHKANIYYLTLGLTVHGDCRVTWQSNLRAGHPKAVPSYREFISAFKASETENSKLPLTFAQGTENMAESIPPSAELPHYFTAPIQDLHFSEAKLKEANLINDEAWEAWEEGNIIKGLKAAYRALEHSPYCADALNYLSLSSSYYEEKCLLSKRAVLVGKASLGDLYIKKNSGQFWDILETRPYMRALFGLAACYNYKREYTQAIEIYREMLKLNQADNMGVRYYLGYLLLLLDHKTELEHYFKEYGAEESCFMLYSKALYLFRIGSANAEKKLQRAIAVNKHVYGFISGEQIIPYDIPDRYGWGDKSEAICYAKDNKEAWNNSPGAVEWFKKNMRSFEQRAVTATGEVTIEQLLHAFLAEQSGRLAKTTYRKYEYVIELLEASIERYSHNYLDDEERELFDQSYCAQHEEENLFCKLFGPDKIAGSAVEFLSYFLPHKVICGKDLHKSSATVVKKLGRWLLENGHIDQDDYMLMKEEAEKATQELPAIDDFSEALYDYVVMSELDDAVEEENELEDVFEVIAVKPGILTLETCGAKGMIEVEVQVPLKLSKLCRVGWQMNLLLVKTKKGWIIIEAGRVSY